jgi:hypothetical protein
VLLHQRYATKSLAVIQEDTGSARAVVVYSATHRVSSRGGERSKHVCLVMEYLNTSPLSSFCFCPVFEKRRCF